VRRVCVYVLLRLRRLNTHNAFTTCHRQQDIFNGCASTGAYKPTEEELYYLEQRLGQDSWRNILLGRDALCYIDIHLPTMGNSLPIGVYDNFGEPEPVVNRTSAILGITISFMVSHSRYVLVRRQHV
jgi:hypothetical protein